MKIKNLILAIFAFTLAGVSAFASFFIPENAYARVKLSSAPGAATVCQDTGVQCDNSGFTTCTINFSNVTNTSNGNQIQTGSTISPYRSGCAVELRGNSTFPLTSTVQIYRLVSNSQN